MGSSFSFTSREISKFNNSLNWLLSYIFFHQVHQAEKKVQALEDLIRASQQREGELVRIVAEQQKTAPVPAPAPVEADSRVIRDAPPPARPMALQSGNNFNRRASMNPGPGAVPSLKKSGTPPSLLVESEVRDGNSAPPELEGNSPPPEFETDEPSLDVESRKAQQLLSLRKHVAVPSVSPAVEVALSSTNQRRNYVAAAGASQSQSRGDRSQKLLQSQHHRTKLAEHVQKNSKSLIQRTKTQNSDLFQKMASALEGQTDSDLLDETKPTLGNRKNLKTVQKKVQKKVKVHSTELQKAKRQPKTARKIHKILMKTKKMPDDDTGLIKSRTQSKMNHRQKFKRGTVTQSLKRNANIVNSNLKAVKRSTVNHNALKTKGTKVISKIKSGALAQVGNKNLGAKVLRSAVSKGAKKKKKSSVAKRDHAEQ